MVRHFGSFLGYENGILVFCPSYGCRSIGGLPHRSGARGRDPWREKWANLAAALAKVEELEEKVLTLRSARDEDLAKIRERGLHITGGLVLAQAGEAAPGH